MLITYPAKLITKSRLTDSVWKFTFTKPEDDSWSFIPGQYMLFHIPDGEKKVIRQYSILSQPHEKYLEFLIELVSHGKAGEFLGHISPGETMNMQGPAGVFTFQTQKTKDVVFLATGTGIVPIYSIIVDQLVRKSTQHLILFVGFRTMQDVLLFEELKTLSEQNSRFTFKICLSRECPSENNTYCLEGRVNQGVQQMLKNGIAPDGVDYYLCGENTIVNSLEEFLADLGVPKNQIHFERFT